MINPSHSELWTRQAYARLTDLLTIVELANERYGKQTFVVPVETDVAPLSFEDVHRFVIGFDHYLGSFKIERGEPCAIISNNSTTLLLQFIATMASGRTFVPINPHTAAEEMAFIIQDSGAKLVLFDSTLASKVSLLESETELVPYEDGARHIESILALASVKGSTGHRVLPEAVAEIVYTTGSTGKPKGVQLTHRNLIADLFGIGQAFDFAPRDRFLTVTPLFHNSGQITTSLIPLYCGGATTAIRPDMGFINFWHFVDRFEPEWSLVMPSHVALMLDKNDSPKSTSLRGILCGGAKLDPHVQRTFESRFSVPIYANYGLTESSSIATCVRPDDAVRSSGSVGRPLDINQIRIDVEGADAAPLERGEIWIKGDNVFGGYVNRPELFAERVTNGWLHTGDLGYLDELGHIHIVDRLDSMVLVGGENVYPSEIERFVPQLPGISEAFVLSLADRIMGRELVMVFKLQQGATADTRTWKAFLQDKLTRFKVPRRFIDVKELGLDDFPRAPNGKLLRKRLQDALDAHSRGAKDETAPEPSAALRKLTTVIAEVLGIDQTSVTHDMHIDEIAAWDSLTHLRLIVSIQDVFGVPIPPARVNELTSVGAILRVLKDLNVGH